MRELEKPLKALANRRRLAILKYVKANREAAVGEIAGAIRLSFRSTSKHLGVLAAADIVERDQRSRRMYYHIARDLEPATEHIIALL